MSDEVEIRTSTITKSIRRVYNIAKYESLEVVVGYEETISWGSLAERTKKTESITSLLQSDFKQTVDKFMDNGEQPKKAKINNALKADSMKDLGLDSL